MVDFVRQTQDMLTEHNGTIRNIPLEGLCTGCGTCAGTCPSGAIEMTVSHKHAVYSPHVDTDRCNQCGLCLEICPGKGVDFGQLNAEAFGKKADDVLIGNFVNCYTGYATDTDIRYRSASGGVVTALLLFALERGIITGALVTRTKPGEVFEQQSFIARTREEIVSACGSRYCPVPANTALKQIRDEDERIAVVGLPCHIHGTRKAAALDGRLRGRIALHFGLLCSATRTFRATEYMLRQAGIDPKDVTRFDHRGEGRWGQFAAELREGQRRPLPYRECYSRVVRSFFMPVRCTLCSDHSSEAADISFGDVDLPELRDDTVGVSSVMSRSTAGENLLANAASAGVIHLSPTDRDRMLHTKRVVLYQKKRDLAARRRLFRLLGRAVPDDTTALIESSWSSYLYAPFHYGEIWISQRRWLWGLIRPLSVVLRLVERLLSKRG